MKKIFKVYYKNRFLNMYKDKTWVPAPKLNNSV